jgi:hypothetical protein
MGDQVESGEFLKDSDRVGCAEYGYGTCQANGPGARSGRTQDDNWGRIHELAAVMFADAKNIEANLVG